MNFRLAFLVTPLSLLLLLDARSADENGGPDLKVIDLRCDFRPAIQAGQHPVPRFGWRLESEREALAQRGYQLLVASTPELLAQDMGDLWDSGEIKSIESQFVHYQGGDLQASQEAHWKVRVTVADGEKSDWSSTARFTQPDNEVPELPDPLFPPDLPRRSSFECSDPTLNRLFNALPQKLPGVSGLRDSTLCLRAALTHFPVGDRAEILLHRLNTSVNQAGLYPAALPPDGTFASTESDAGIVFAHTLWWMTGNNDIPRDYWPIMLRYVYARKGLDPAVEGAPLGELPPDTLPPGDPTPPGFVHLTSQGLNVRLLRELGRIGGRSPFEALELAEYHQKLSEKFRSLHLVDDLSLKYDSLTAQLLALRCGLLSNDAQKEAITKAVLASLEKLKDTSPFEQSPYAAFHILPVLTFTDHYEQALKLSKDLDPDQLSAVALSSISEWLMSIVAGIGTEEWGFQRIVLQPHIPSSEVLEFAKAHFDSRYGRIAVHWRHEADAILVDATIPPNTTTLLRLPATEQQTITESDKRVDQSPERFPGFGQSGGVTSFRAGSGSYRFRITK